MTASKHCKALCGLSLAEVSRRVGKPRQTLENWHKDNIALFDMVCMGCLHAQLNAIEQFNMEVASHENQ